jgi:hypothetical protein
MGLLMGALAGAAGAVEKTTEYALRSMMDTEKAQRIAEFASELDSNKDLTKRARDKAGAEEERARIGGLLSKEVEVTQGDGMLAPATDDPAERTVTTRKPTNEEMVGRAVASGDIATATAVGKLDDKDKDREIKTAIAMGKFENALQIAQLKGEFGMMIGELKAAAAGGSGKATEMMRNWEFLKKQGYTDEKAGEALLSGKVGEYTTTATEGFDAKGNKVTTTVKSKPGNEAPKAQKTVKFGDLNK